jgi:predicted ATPase
VFAALEAGQSVAVDGAAGSTLDQLVAHLEDRSLIVVLDNCEHVIGAAATLVETLVERVPALQMIATSREALGVPGEVLLPVGPLPIEDAVKVFTDRAEAVRLDFVTDESNRSMVEDVCRRLDGMPLALELAAARMRSLPLGQLVDRLDDRFRVLTGGARTALPRQQTLRAVVDWSYDLLFEDERRLFARLSVFAGGCTLEAAEHVCGDEIVSDDQVCDLLLRLVDKSLVLAELDGADARYTQLQTLWQYARERLAESSEADEFRQSHARWFLDMARRARPLLRGRTAVEWRARIFADWDNVRSAFDWFAEAGDAQSAFSLVDGVAWSWFARNDPHEAVRWLDDALAVRGPSTPELRSMVVAWHAYFNAQILGPENERTELLEALDVLRAGSDQRRLADALMIAAELCNRSQQGAESQGFADEARVVLVELGDEWGLAICDSLTARNHSLAGRLDESVEFATASIDRLKAIGEESLIFEGLGQLAILLEVRGDLDAAAAAYADLKAESHTRGLPLYEIQWTVRLAALRSRQGDDAGAEALFTEFLAIDSIPAGKAWALMGRGGAVRRQGDLARARRDLDEALDVYEALGLPAGYALALSALSWWAIDAGDLEAAATFAERARSSATEQPDELVRLVVDTAGVAAALVRADSAATRSTFTALLADRARIGTGRYIALIGGPIGAYLDEPDVAALTKGLGLALV